MPISLDLQPLVPSRQPYGLDIKPHANAVLSGREYLPFIAQAFAKIQDSVNYIETAVRQFNPGEFGEIVVKSSDGTVIAWIGDDPPYYGAWFKQLYVGGDGPDTAPFFADEDGNVIIGVNGSVAIQDSGGNEFGWLGYQSDAAKNITGATNANPIQITCNAHGYEDGDTVLIQNVGGNTAANGYRIVKNAAANTFQLTDLDGVNVAGNGSYTSGGTTTRYFGGGRFQTLAVGESFTNYKIRAYANGDLKILDALIRLEDPGQGFIELNPVGPIATFEDLISNIRTTIEDGFITIDNSATASPKSVLSASSLTLSNSSSNPNVFIQSAFGGHGAVSVYDNAGNQTIGLNGSTGTVTCEFINAAQDGSFDNISVTNTGTFGTVSSGVYEIGGTPGVSDSQTLVTNVTVNTASAVTSVDFGTSTTTSDTFVTGITLTTVSLSWSGGLLV